MEWKITYTENGETIIERFISAEEHIQRIEYIWLNVDPHAVEASGSNV